MKKLRLGEFQEVGFSVSMKWRCALSSNQEDSFLTRLLEQVIDARGLAYGGGSHTGFVCRLGKGSATEGDREALSAWLSDQEGIETVTVGPLQDCWHDGPQFVP